MGVDGKKLAGAVATHSTILIDTSILVAYLDGEQNITAAATLLIDDWLHRGRNRGFVSTISAMELLVGPLKARRSTADYLDFLQRFPNLTCVPVNLNVAQASASVRANHSVRTPDALIIGTAIAIGADVIATNDRAWGKIAPMPVVLLNDYVT